MINLTLIIPTTIRDAVKALRDNGESPANLSKVLQMVGSKDVNREFPRGDKTFTTIYAVVEDVDLEDVLASYPDSEVIEARVHETGLHYGQSFDVTYDTETGEETKTIVGVRAYPAHSDHIKICPDIVTMDYSDPENPVVASSKRPTEVSYQVSIAGAAKRMG